MPNADLTEKLRAVVAEVAELDEVPDGTPFKDLGIDSMMAIEIISDVERAFKTSIILFTCSNERNVIIIELLISHVLLC